MEHCNNCNYNSSCGENRISVSNTNTSKAINITNNKARYYAELAEIYKNEAQEFRDTAQYYAEQNSDVTIEYVDQQDAELMNLIDEKQATLVSGTNIKTINSTSLLGAGNIDVADLSLSNLNATGQAILNHKLDKKQLSNCILEAPCNKITISDGTATLASGATLIFPYGTTNQSSSFPAGATFGTNLVVLGTVWDGTNNRFFIRVKTTADLTHSATGTANYKSVYYVTSAGVLTRYGLGSTTSGTTAPTWGLFYNTSANKVSLYSNGSIANDNVSFPIAIGTTNSSGANGTIDQTFNGLGYIGGVVWLDKGVKTLKPNGRNTDGTLNNTESTTTGISLINLSSASDGVRSILLDGPGNFTHTGSSIQYNPDTNYYMASTPNAKYCVLGKVTISSGTISLAVFKNVLSINDLIDGQWVSSYTEIARQVTLPTSGATSYSLASYLPNDNYNYEVILRGAALTAATSGAIARLGVASSIIYNTDYFPSICTAQTTTNTQMVSRSSIILPVGKDRTIYIASNTDNNGTFTLFALGYRRIGRND